MIRLLSVDDHPIVRDGIVRLIATQPDMKLIAEASDGQEAVEQFRKHQPDVTLMDLQMPNMNGIDAIGSIRGEFPEARIIVLTTYEGDVQVGVRPYPISYRSIVPKASECENLFVPVCLAASHIAYGSIRMEPVFMILGQSAATAAVLAIDGHVPAQKVEYAKLRNRLLADRQILEWKK